MSDDAAEAPPPCREARVTQMTVVKPGEPIFDDTAIQVQIVDEAAGEFVEIVQHLSGREPQKIGIDPAEWLVLRDVIDRMVGECRE